jgi:hypothetical protein
VLLVALPAIGKTITIDDYLARLEHIQQLVAAKQSAANEARELANADVLFAQGTFHADPSLLDAAAKAKSGDLQVQLRIATTIAEVRSAAGVGGATQADPELLKRVAAEQKVPELAAGGEIAVTPKTTPLTERVADSLERVWDWIIDKLGRLLDWFLDLFPDSAGHPGATGGMRWIVAGLVAIIVLLIAFLALEARRRAQRGAKPDVETSEPLGSKRDEDPLSRGASEWERYAAQLAQTGRFREAIRAWFHAALVTCYAGGVLHYRKSRTNWEYIATLAPSLEWRPDFISLTRRFEREWYGADQSSLDAYEDCQRKARVVIENVRGAA